MYFQKRNTTYKKKHTKNNSKLFLNPTKIHNHPIASQTTTTYPARPPTYPPTQTDIHTTSNTNKSNTNTTTYPPTHPNRQTNIQKPTQQTKVTQTTSKAFLETIHLNHLHNGAFISNSTPIAGNVDLSTKPSTHVHGSLIYIL